MSDKKDLDEGVWVGNHHCIADEIEGKKSCESSDACGCYEHEDDEGNLWYDAYCRSCSQVFNKEEVHGSSLVDELEIEEEVEGQPKKKKTKKYKPVVQALTPEQVKAMIKTYGYECNNYRDITEETCRFFGCLTSLDIGGNVKSRYYPETEDYTVTGYACRNHPKDFRYGRVGRTGSKSDLYGQIKFKRGNAKYVLVVGGQEDCHAAFQMLRDSQRIRGHMDYEPIAVVSVTTGEGSGYNQLAREYDWLDTFENIIIGFDNDAAGIEATESAVKVLPKDKVKVVSWSGKDPNKMLNSGKHKQFLKDFYSAKECVKSDIKHSANSYDAAIEFLSAPKIPLPPYLHRLQKAMRGGIKTTGAIINLIGDTSIGKSVFTDSLLYDWFWTSPIVPTIISLERTAGELAVDFISMHLKHNLSWYEDGKEAVEIISSESNKELIEQLLVKESGESRYYILDERSGEVQALCKIIERAIKQYGSKLIILDPLTDFLRALGTEAQEDFMMWQKRMKKEGIIFFNILHTRKPMPDKDGKIRKVSEYDALGSGTFVQSSDGNIVINRDKMSTDLIIRNTTSIDLPKIRGGTTGHVCDIYYNNETRTLHDKQDYFEGKTVNKVSKPSKASKIGDK
jgi:twinkle protein